MTPLYISLKNYKRYGDKETTLDLSENGVKLITGKIGTGKTSFVDGLIWCLYGKSMSSVDDVVNRKNGKNCKVEFCFYRNNDKITVSRYRKDQEHKNNVYLYKNDKNISGADNKKTQDLINEILDISHKAMVSAVAFSSELYVSFSRSKGSAERLKIFENILSLSIVNKWLEQTKKFIKPIEEKIAEYEQKIEKAEYGIETLNSNITQYKETTKKKILDLKNEREEIKETIVQIEKEIEEINKIDSSAELEKLDKLEEVKKHNQNIQEKIEKKKEQLPTNINDLLKEYNDIKSQIEKISSIDADKEIAKIQNYKEKKDEYDKKNYQIKELQNKIKDANSLREKRKETENKIKKLEKELSSLKHDLICPTCKQNVPQEQLENLDYIKNTEEEISSEISFLENELSEESIKFIEEENSKIFSQIEEIKNTLPELVEPETEYSIEELSNLKNKKIELEKNLSVKENEFNLAKNNQEKIEESINELKEETLEETQETVKYSREFLENIQNELKEKTERKKELENRIESINESAKNVYDKNYIEDLNNKIKKLETEKKKNNTYKEKKEEEKKYYDFFYKFFSNKEGGFKKQTIGKMIDKFNKKVNEYLPFFMPDELSNIYITFDENLQETITEGKNEISYDTFSSGQKTTLELAIAFSLFMLAKEFFSNSISFIAFDEILDGNLDEDSYKRILTVIEDLAQNNSIILISHRKEIKDRFSNHIEIDFDKNGYSTIVEK